jgi:phosphatidylglycerophosphate synthase
MEEQKSGRREVSSRNTAWAHAVVRYLAARSITPNQISVLSTVFSALGGGVLFGSVRYGFPAPWVALIVYIVGIQLRLLCNLFDGMVAVEGGKKSRNGDLYNDVPDRFSDALLIVPAGYVAGGIGVELGWLAALLAVMTAYLRWIGACKTRQHFFNGPMAKQHRMFLLTVAAAIGLCLTPWGYERLTFGIMLAVMNLLLIATIVNRLRLIARAETTEEENA